METRQEQGVELNKDPISISGIVVGLALGAFLFWLTIKGVQLYSW
jgi:hypothetical protein